MDFDNFWQMLPIKSCFIFPPRLTGVFALPGETGNKEIVPFYLNAVCCFVNRHTKDIKISTGHS